MALNDRAEFLEFASKASGEPEHLVLAYVRAWLIAGEIHDKVDTPEPALFKLKLADRALSGVSPEVVHGPRAHGPRR